MLQAWADATEQFFAMSNQPTQEVKMTKFLLLKSIFVLTAFVTAPAFAGGQCTKDKAFPNCEVVMWIEKPDKIGWCHCDSTAPADSEITYENDTLRKFHLLVNFDGTHKLDKTHKNPKKKKPLGVYYNPAVKIKTHICYPIIVGGSYTIYCPPDS